MRDTPFHGFVPFKTWVEEATFLSTELWKLCRAQSRGLKVRAAYNRAKYIEQRQKRPAMV